ncbi:MAG: hypothetical protein HQK53_11475, partial [Oligoflexia bacterium]|nr:hypothetical protein [Oligoflexia bacterium]
VVVGGGSAVSSSPPAAPARILGYINQPRNVWGTYLHGIFDDDVFRRFFIDWLRQRKKLSPINKVVAHYDLTLNFDRLASIVRETVDIQKIYDMLKL